MLKFHEKSDWLMIQSHRSILRCNPEMYSAFPGQPGSNAIDSGFSLLLASKKEVFLSCWPISVAHRFDSVRASPQKVVRKCERKPSVEIPDSICLSI